MINLIPNTEKKKKIKDFYFRLTVIAFMMLGFAALLASAAILPAYFLSSVKNNFINRQIEAQKNEPIPPLGQEILANAETLDGRLTLVEKIEDEKYLISEKIINEIVKSKLPNIKILHINYKNSATTGKMVGVNGAASSREELLKFRQKLEENPAFQKVDLPINNFIKGTNIEFSLILTPA